MSAPANPNGILSGILVAILTCAAAGCGSNPPRDVNFGTDKGADFHAPVVDAHSDATSDAGAAGGGGAGGSDTSATGGAAGGTAGSNLTGVAGADGAADAPGAGG